MVFLNYDGVPLLSLLLVVPWLGALFVSGIPADRSENVKRCTLWIHAVVILLVGIIYQQFDPTLVGCQLAEKVRWISRLGIHYDVALDHVALVLVGCASLFSFAAALCSQESKTRRYKMAMVFALVLEGGVLGCLCSNNVLLLYLLTEMIFFAFLFFLNTSIRGPSTLSIPTVLSLLSSLVIFLLLFEISQTGTHSLDVARYEPMVLPARWVLCFLAAILLRLYVLLKKVQQYSRQVQPSKTVLMLALGPVFLSQMLLVFRLSVLFALAVDWLPLTLFPLLVLALLSLARYLAHLRQGQRATLEFFPLVARWTVCLVSLTCLAPGTDVRAGLLLMATYSLGVMGLLLRPSVTSTLQTFQRGASEMMTLALLGAPCSGGFWAYMSLLRQFFSRRYMASSLLFLAMFVGVLSLGGCYSRDLVEKLEVTSESAGSGPVGRSFVIMFWVCWGLMISLVVSPLIG